MCPWVPYIVLTLDDRLPKLPNVSLPSFLEVLVYRPGWGGVCCGCHLPPVCVTETRESTKLFSRSPRPGGHGHQGRAVSMCHWIERRWGAQKAQCQPRAPAGWTGRTLLRGHEDLFCPQQALWLILIGTYITPKTLSWGPWLTDFSVSNPDYRGLWDCIFLFLGYCIVYFGGTCARHSMCVEIKGQVVRNHFLLL